MKDALRGIKVLDLSTLLPGPLASLYLAEAGAEVTKIEAPGGEDMRRFPPFLPDGQSACYALLNKGKTILELDLKSEEGKGRLAPLVAECDVLLEGFRPGVLDRFGLSYDLVREVNPRVIYCSVTGYGQSGPDRDRPGHDLNFIAESGVLGTTRGNNGQPTLPPLLAADIAGGAYPAVIEILLALFQRERTGLGARLDIAMRDNMRVFAWWALAYKAVGFPVPGDGEWAVTGASPRYGIYPTKDGRALAVGALENKFWDRLCELADLEPGLRDDRQSPAASAAALADKIVSRTAMEWRDLLEGVDCCTSVVESLSDVLSHESPDTAMRLFGKNWR